MRTLPREAPVPRDLDSLSGSEKSGGVTSGAAAAVEGGDHDVDEGLVEACHPVAA